MLLSVYCGDGVRDNTAESIEECDDGEGSEADLCSERCQVNDALAVRGPAFGESRTLGESRHPLAAGEQGFGVVYVESDAEPPIVGLSVFDAAGDPRARIAASAGATPIFVANPVVASLADGSYAVAWTDFDGDRDGLGIALRRVTPTPGPPLEPPEVAGDLGAVQSPLQFATGELPFSQYDADMVVAGDTLVVAWTDTSDDRTAPDLRYRLFAATPAAPSAALSPFGSEQELATSERFEGNVALAAIADGWAAAWRSSDGGGHEIVEVFDASASGLRWSVGPHDAGSEEDHPALAELDENRLIVLYTVGTDPENSGILAVPRLRATILNRSDPETQQHLELPPAHADYTDPAIGQVHPNLVRVGDVLYVAWRSASRSGDASQENAWLRAYDFSAGLPVPLGTERAIPRWQAGLPGDQRFPALAVGPRWLGTEALPEPAPAGALAVAWDDYGRTLQGDQGQPDVLVQHWPLSVLRFDEPRPAVCSPADPCGPGEGHCDADSECQSGLVCLSGQGPQYGLAPGVSVCVSPHCTNEQQDPGETGIDCGGADCGTCLCGDGIVLAASGEECDDAGESADCDVDCTFAECGDGLLNLSNDELCDDANQIDTDACHNDCTPGIWSPVSLSPVAWYFASPSDVVLESGAVAQWSDRSGNGRHIASSVAALQPIYDEDGWSAAQPVQPTVTFNGGKMLWREPWSGAPAGDDAAFTVLAVMRSATSHNGGIAAWWDVNGGGNTWCMLKSDHGGETVLETTRMDFLARGQILRGRHDLGSGRHVVAWRYSPEEMKLTVDGITTSLPQDSVGAVTLGTFLVGALNMFGSSMFQGDISELVIVPRGLSDLEVAQFRSYARQTWRDLPASSLPPNPCTNAMGQPSLPSKACNDGVAATYGDHCQSGGVCAGSVPPSGSPAGLSPAAWYVAASSEVTLDTGSLASQWLDRSGNGRHLMQTHPQYKPSYAPTGWNETKPTLAFAGSNVLRKNSWNGPPEGDDASFTVLAVTRSAQPQNGGPFGFGQFDGYWQVRSSLTDSGGATLLGLFRQDDFANQSFSLATDLKTERHVIAWRYSPDVMMLTVDGVTATSSNLASLNLLHIDTFLLGVDNTLGFNAFRGEISELAVIPSSITEQQVSDFTSYARTTWGGLPECGFGPGDRKCEAIQFCDDDGVCKTRPCSLSDPWASMIQVVDSDFVDGIAVLPDGLSA